MRPPELIFDKQHPPLDKNAQVLRLMTMLDDALHQESPEDEIKLKDFRNSLNQIKSDYGDQETGSILQILLHQAFFSKLYMVRSLLKEGADINKTFKVGDREGTILSFVIEAQAWTKLNRVISGGADVTAIKRDKQQEILIPAIEAEQFLFVNALLLQPGAPELLKQSLKELKISKSFHTSNNNSDKTDLATTYSKRKAVVSNFIIISGVDVLISTNSVDDRGVGILGCTLLRW